MRCAVFAVLVAAAPQGMPDRGGEVLYNGIRLPSPWPPRDADLLKDLPTPHSLVSPPEVIPIDLGRQLFVDDFLVAETTLRRTYHLAKYHPANPVLKPDRPWEGEMAMAFSDGAWWDPKDKLFKIWYMAGPERATCTATSEDGLRWNKPALDSVKPGTNIVHTGHRDSSTVWLDQEGKDPSRRFKMFRSVPAASPLRHSWILETYFSADGLRWTAEPLLTGFIGDRTTVFWNPFRKVWVYSIRLGLGDTRQRRYWEMTEAAAGPQWSSLGEPPLWVGSDSLDPVRKDLKVRCQLYNLDAIAYESILLGLFTIWRGQPADRHKPNEVCLGYSRDGWSWTRPDRRAFCPVSDRQGDWNANNVQSVAGGCLIVGDELWFYVSGRAGVPGSSAAGVCTTGLATLRRDGFASMDGDGTLTTRPVRFSGKRLFVNLQGELRADVLNERGEVLARSETVAGDRTSLGVPLDLAGLAGKPVRFRFHLKGGKLYSFWVAADDSGASRGYVAAGGPGFTGPTDTVGRSR